MPQQFVWRTMVSNGEGGLHVVAEPSRVIDRPARPQLPPPPLEESVCEIPVLSPEYFLFLCKLKREASELSIALAGDGPQTKIQSIQTDDAKNYDGYKSTGYMVFTSYYICEFDMLPRHLALKFLGPAWLAYPDKPVWQSYAHQYNLYSRDIDVVTWLNKVPKHPRDGIVFILSPKSYDRALIEVSRHIKLPQRFIFVSDTSMYQR